MNKKCDLCDHYTAMIPIILDGEEYVICFNCYESIRKEKENEI